jgi:transposase
MATLDAQVEANLGPFRTAVDLVMSIPGIKNLGAHVIVSEIGIDMSRLPSDAHLISWACICPLNDESAGKRRSSRLNSTASTRPQEGDHRRRRLHLPHSRIRRYTRALVAITSSAVPPTSKKNRLVKRLADLGYAVEIKPLAA